MLQVIAQALARPAGMMSDLAWMAKPALIGLLWKGRPGEQQVMHSCLAMTDLK
jgi:hypothetical protein